MFRAPLPHDPFLLLVGKTHTNLAHAIALRHRSTPQPHSSQCGKLYSMAIGDPEPTATGEAAAMVRLRAGLCVPRMLASTSLDTLCSTAPSRHTTIPLQEPNVREALDAIKAANKRSSLGDDWGADDARSWPYVKLDAEGRLVELCVLFCCGGC